MRAGSGTGALGGSGGQGSGGMPPSGTAGSAAGGIGAGAAAGAGAAPAGGRAGMPNPGGAGMGQGGTAGAGVGATGGMPAGGKSASGGAPMGGGGAPAMDCTIDVTQSMSDKISTVGIVEFTTDAPSVDSARVEFGLDTTYGMTAPVDLAEPNYRTILLGMKTSHTYHYRVVVTSGGKECASADATLETGPPPNGLSKPTVDTKDAGKLYGGYMVTSRWGMGNGGPAMILDSDADLVWWYPVEDDVIRTRFSYDGKRMWITNTSESDGGGWVRRVTLDGMNEEKWDLVHATHDLAVLPNGNVAIIAHAADGCWDVEEFNPTTEELTPLFNPSQAHGSTMCQVNYLAYYQGDDSFFVSDYRQSTVIKFTHKGDLVWVLNGTKSTISGTNWSGQHGIHALGPDHLIVFSNSGEPTDHTSIVYELQVDETAKTAETLWRYDGGLNTSFGGDVQRLDNGNTLLTYSSSGVIQELGPSHELLQTITFPINNSLAYMVKRRSLYGGPPPKINGI